MTDHVFQMKDGHWSRSDMKAADLPFREIWLEPFCEECWTGRDDITWCQDRVYSECVECGRKPIRYALDKRQFPRRHTEAENQA